MTLRRRTVRWLMGLALLVSIISLVAVPPQTLAGTSKLVTMPAFGDVQNYEISPDGNWVVYRADQDTDGVNELYSVPLWPVARPPN